MLENQPQFPPAVPAVRQREKGHYRAGWKEHADQSACQHGQRAHGGGSPVTDTRIETPRPSAKEQVEDGCEFQRVDSLGNDVASKMNIPTLVAVTNAP